MYWVSRKVEMRGVGIEHAGSSFTGSLRAIPKEKVVRVRTLAVLFALMAALSSAQQSSKILRAAEPVPGEYIVAFREHVLAAQVPGIAREMADKHGGKVLATFSAVPGFGIAVSESEAERLVQDPRVAFVEENAYGHLSYNVEYYSSVDDRWHLNRIDQRLSIYENGLYAYGWTYDGSGVDVYVLDSGIMRDIYDPAVGYVRPHDEFRAGQVLDGTDYSGSDGFTATTPCGGTGHYYAGGHGTGVASVIAGRTVGVARGATLIPVKVGYCNTTISSEPEFNLTAISVLYGVDWAIKYRNNERGGRPSILNLSLFFTATSPTHPDCAPDGNCIPYLEQILRTALDEGFIVVTSANNQNTDRCDEQSPARYSFGTSYCPYSDCAITVGGTNKNDNRFTCSSGYTCVDEGNAGSNYGPCVSIWAPAHYLRSAHIASHTAFRDDPYWLQQAQIAGRRYDNETIESVSSGTSLSAGIVSGVVARWLSNPAKANWRARDVWQYLQTSDGSTGITINVPTSTDPIPARLVYISVYD